MPSDVSSVKRILNSKYTAIVILIIASIGVYLNTLPNEFVYDDKYQVLENHWIRDVKNIPEIFLSNVWAFEGSVISNYYRPLMHIIYMIDYHIFGLKPWGFHLTNIIFHTGVTLLVFLIASILINQSHALNSKSHPEQVGTNPKSKILNPKSKILNLKSEIPSPAFIAALLFAVHPIHTEAVAWIGGIPDLSFTLFYLLSFYLYTKAEKILGKQFFLSLLFFFLAALCKEPALTLPILLLAYDYSISRTSVYSSRFTVHSIIKRYLPYLIVSGIYLILRTYVLGGFAPLKVHHTGVSNYQYFINIFPLFTQYLEKLILPINLNIFYVFHPISSIFEWKGIIALIITLAFIFLVFFFRKNKVVFLCLLWIIIPLLPVLYIPALAGFIFAERYLYLPSIGFAVLVALAIEKVYPVLCNSTGIYQLKALRQSCPEASGFRIVIVSILVILTGLYSIGTIKRNYIWKDSYSLWTDTVEKSPDSPPAHNDLGIVYYKQGRFDEAIKEYLIALRLKPDYAEAHNDLGIVYSKLGRFDEAIKEYLIALRLRPDAPLAHYNLGNVYSKQGRFDEAIREYMAALKLRPNYPDAHNELGIVHSKQGKLDEAIREYMTVIKLKHDAPEAHNNIGNAYSEKGELDKAMEHYQIALKLKPDYPDAHYNLGIVYQKKGLEYLAKEEFEMALKLRQN